MQTQFEVLVKEMHADLNKIGCAHSIDRAELESELWLYFASQTEQIDRKAAGRHLVSRSIELSRTNGVSSARAVSFDDTECTLADHLASDALDPLSALLAAEDEAERNKRIASLDSLTKARLSAAECARSASEMGRTLGFKGRKARHILSSWLKDAAQHQPQSQSQLF